MTLPTEMLGALEWWSFLPLVLVGAGLWTVGEYVLHRFAFHERRGKNYGSREHLRHHGHRDYRLWKNPEAWVGVACLITVIRRKFSSATLERFHRLNRTRQGIGVLG